VSSLAEAERQTPGQILDGVICSYSMIATNQHVPALGPTKKTLLAQAVF